MFIVVNMLFEYIEPRSNKNLSRKIKVQREKRALWRTERYRQSIALMKWLCAYREQAKPAYLFSFIFELFSCLIFALSTFFS